MRNDCDQSRHAVLLYLPYHLRSCLSLSSPLPPLQPPNHALLRASVAGYVFDSCPIDFVSAVGVRFLSQPPGKRGPPSRVRGGVAQAAAAVLHTLFQAQLEGQRREFWATLERCVVKSFTLPLQAHFGRHGFERMFKRSTF